MPALPPTYRHWQQQVRCLLEPLAALMHPGRADLAIAGPASDHDAQADRLETFARPLLLAAFWLQSAFDRSAVLQPALVGGATSAPPTFDDDAFRSTLADWFRAALVLGTDPDSPEYWGPDAAYHQHHVEMGLLAVALQIAPADLWDPLPQAGKDQVARWLGSSRGGGIVNNNHLFMSVHILEFLGRHGYGRPVDRAVITAHLRQLETMHRGGGWFEDGINQAFDHYNAHAFHFYGLWWARLHGAREPTRAQRWREWAGRFIHDYQHFFAASGEHPAFGRSLIYRFNACNVFGLAVATGATDLPLGRLRRLCTRNLDFFLSRPITQEQGCLAFGWTDRFEALAESYSCSGSPYWCAKGFAALTIPPDHPFWQVPEEPLPAEQGDFAHPIPSAGLLVRGIGGAVELLNAGSQISNLNLRYGAWKWSKTAYRTGVGFTLAFPPPTNWSHDSAVTLTLDDGRVFGRHSTVPVEMDEVHLGYSWGLGHKTNQINCGMETFLWWRAGWLLQVHAFAAHQPGVLRLGGYALALARPGADLPVTAAASVGSPVLGHLAVFAPDGRGTALQALHGFTGAEWDNRLDDSTPRAHLDAPYHVTPVFKTDRLHGRGWLVALAWAGHERAESAPWRVVSGAAGAWQLSHPSLGPWEVRHWSLPALA